MVNWVSSLGGRSTFDILWSCLAVVVVCTYKVVHLNVPARAETEANWRTVISLKRYFRKLKWMSFMALAPELLLSMALQDWLWARDWVKPEYDSNTEKIALGFVTIAQPDALATPSLTAYAPIPLMSPRHVPLRYVRLFSRQQLREVNNKLVDGHAYTFCSRTCKFASFVGCHLFSVGA